ncbi:DUF7139 domain-containing protein [Haloarcula litorea]|uniref:DUF7139 domain-containing protein n=1 Tax=Haloarcula litorea TaxID=3032579 RepID=UPI0023E7DD17|nr:hypothetical protein [Halomicroarcula sp. GDY20]
MATGNPKGMMLDCYRRYIGSIEEVSEVDVVFGMGLTMGGVALSVAGWLAFLWNETMAAYGTSGFYTVREVAIVVAGLGLPLFLLGVVTMTLGSDRMTALSLAGTAVCVGAVLLFLATYPNQWDVPAKLHAPLGVSLYGVGAGMLVFATGAAYSCRVTGR